MGGRIGYLVAVLSSTACIVTPMRVLLHTEGNPLGKLCAEECSSGVDEVRRLLARAESSSRSRSILGCSSSSSAACS